MGMGIAIRRSGVAMPRLSARKGVRVKARKPRMPVGRSYVRIGTGRARLA